MDTPRLPHERLDAYVLARANELGIRLKDVADFIDVSEPTLIGWRRGTQRPTLRYAQRLDDFMGWQKAPSSTLAVLNGGEPVKVRDEPIRPKKPHTDQLPVSEGDPIAAVVAEIESMKNLRDDQRAILIETLRAAIQAQMEATREQAHRLNQAERDAS